MTSASKTVLGASIKWAQYLLRELKEALQVRVVFIDLALN